MHLKLKLIPYLICSLACSLLANNTYAQSTNDWSIYSYVKSHKFYNLGAYTLKDLSKATGYGFGVSIHKPIHKNISVFGGYGFALADSLTYGEYNTSNAVFHQIEANLAINLNNIWKLKPYIYTGYAYNYIQQIDRFDQKNSGMNVNLGIGSEIKLNDALGLGYQLTYAFSLSDNIPFNFRHQLGIHYHPNLAKRKESSVFVENSDDIAMIEKLKEQNKRLQFQRDSLSLIAKSETISEKPIQNTGIVARQNNELIERVLHLEEDNQLLLNEVRSRRFASDSIYRTNFNSYTPIDTLGQVIYNLNLDLKSGFYLLIQDLSTMGELRTFNLNSHFGTLESKIYLNRLDRFLILGYLGDDKDKALKYFSEISEEKYRYRIIVF